MEASQDGRACAGQGANRSEQLRDADQKDDLADHRVHQARPDAEKMDGLVRHLAGASAGQDGDRLDDHRKEEDHDCRRAEVRGSQLATDPGCRSASDVAVVLRDEAAQRQQDERRHADRNFVGPEHRAAALADAGQMGLERVGPWLGAKAARAGRQALALVPEEFVSALRPERELQASQWLEELAAVARVWEAEPVSAEPALLRNLARLEPEFAAQQRAREQAASLRLVPAAEAAQPAELLASQQRAEWREEQASGGLP